MDNWTWVIVGTAAALPERIVHSFYYDLHSVSSNRDAYDAIKRAYALRADGLRYHIGLVLTQPVSPTPWTRPQRSHSQESQLQSDY